MSLKSKRNSPRAMPVETILTRYKSSQLKQSNKTVKVNKDRFLQHKEQSKHDINGTNKQKRRKVTAKTDKKDDIVCVEFHPDKLKRNMNIRKVILKPKHDYKVVLDANNCNKRKLNVPIKDVKRIRTISESSLSSQDSIHTISEMITLLDATDNLNDEDLMEILTCPSPVWWEDLPPGYKEDSLSAQFTQMNNKSQDQFIKKNIDSKLPYKEKSGSDNDKSQIDNNKIKLNSIFKEKDSKYINKRRKLEALLGNIKDKVKNKTQSGNHNEEMRSDKINLSNKHFKSNKDCIKIGKTLIKSPNVYVDKIKTNKNLNTSKYNNKSVNTIVSKCNSINTNRSLLLHNYISKPKNSNIDNINENFEKLNENISNNCQTNYHTNNESVKSLEENDKNPKSNIISETNNVFEVIDINSDEANDDILNTSLDDDTLLILENIEIPIHDSTIDNSPTNLLETTDNYINRTKITDRNTTDDVDDKKEIILIEDGGKANALNLKKSSTDQNKTAFNISKALERDTSDFITVYKIMSKGSLETEKNGNINSYFKKSKFRPKKSLDNLNDDTDDSSGKNRIVVPTKEIVKYCLKCSTIFNTEDCEYCIKKINNA